MDKKNNNIKSDNTKQTVFEENMINNCGEDSGDAEVFDTALNSKNDGGIEEGAYADVLPVPQSVVTLPLSGYDKNIHTYGRIWVSICTVLFMIVPIIFALYLKAMPIWSALLTSFLSVAAIYWLSAFAEFAIYAPMLGSGATYLAFVTGNISSIKLPCAVNAQEITGVKRGTKESEIVSTLAVASSAITTTVIMSLGVLLIALFSSQLDAFFSHPVVEPAFGCILMALFGALGYSFIIKKPKLGILPVALMIILFVVAPSIANEKSVGTMIIISGVISIASAILFFKKGWVK